MRSGGGRRCGGIGVKDVFGRVSSSRSSLMVNDA